MSFSFYILCMVNNAYTGHRVFVHKAQIMPITSVEELSPVEGFENSGSNLGTASAARVRHRSNALLASSIE